MKKPILLEGEYYHIYCRGNNKARIFNIEKDYWRLLTTILLFQSSVIFPQFGRIVDKFIEESINSLDQKLISEIEEQRTVELVAFVLVPTHFHLILHQPKKNGVVDYMHRVMTSYTNYTNIRHERSGHLFQGRYGRVHISSNDQLLYLSTYLHRHPREFPGWSGKEHLYPWSSYQDYTKENRWGTFLIPNIIIEQFSSIHEYQVFTSESIAKSKNVLDNNLIYPSFR